MKGFTIEKGSGVALTAANCLVKDILDMNEIEFWEDRLDKLEQPYVTAFRTRKGYVYYSIFCKQGSKNSAFRHKR